MPRAEDCPPYLTRVTRFISRLSRATETAEADRPLPYVAALR